MDVLSSFSRWVVSKRVDMQHLFEQWAQGPRSDTAAIGSAKGLTHAQPADSMLDMFKLLPMGMTVANVTSDKDSNLVMNGNTSKTNDMGFPVVRPPYKQTSQCKEPKPVSISQMEHDHKGNQQHKLHCTSPKSAHSMASHVSPELAKSSLWKHIFAPPFTPASARTKYANIEPAIDLSHIYPYSQQVGLDPTEAVPVWYNSGCFNNSNVFGQATIPGYKTCSMNYGVYTGQQPFPQIVPPPFYSMQSSDSIFVPGAFYFGMQPSPIQVQHQFQAISLPPQTHHQTGPLYCEKRQTTVDSSPQKAFYMNEPLHVLPVLPISTTSRSTAFYPQPPPAESISKVTHSLKALHISTQPPSGDDALQMAKAFPPQTSIQLPVTDSTEHSCADVALNCDIPLSVESSAGTKQQTCMPSVEVLASSANESEQKQDFPPTPVLVEKRSSTRETFSHYQPCFIPTSNPRKKRKTRPSAEKRRRRRMAADCALSATAAIQSSDKSHQKKKTGHHSTSHDLDSYDVNPVTIAFIDSEDDSELEEDQVPLTVKTFCFSISCDSDDSDFDDLSYDTSDGVPHTLDEVAWSQLNISLDPFNFQCVSVPSPTIKKVSSPELTPYIDGCHSGTGEVRQSTVESPERRNSLGKHVKFAAADCLVTIHMIEDDLDAYQEARKGHWEVFARDRSRFRKRVEEVEEAIGHVFDPDHRRQVLKWRAVALCKKGEYQEDSSQ